MPKVDIVAVLRNANRAADAILGEASADIDKLPAEVPQPAALVTPLMKYQLMGLHFMAMREAQKNVTHPYELPGI